MKRPVVIAVDGTAASGKGTLARGLADMYDLDYLDTGSLYRAVAWIVLRNGGDPKNRDDAISAAESINQDEIDDSLLRFDEISRAAAGVAAIQEVRLILLKLQRDFATISPTGRSCIMDGRDIGTVVVPHANVKLFVTARVEIRAHRRFLELSRKDPSVVESDILRELIVRDQQDTNRPISPMRPANDAVQIDTSDLSVDQALTEARHIVEAKTALRPRGVV